MNIKVHEILAFEVRIEWIFEVFSSPIQGWNFQAFLATSILTSAKTLWRSQTSKIVIMIQLQ